MAKNNSHLPKIARGVNRMSWLGPATLLVGPPGAQNAYGSRIVSVSGLGLKLSTSRPLVPGQVVDVIPFGNGGSVLPCRVAWVGQAGSPEKDQVGLEFLSPAPVARW